MRTKPILLLHWGVWRIKLVNFSY